MLITVQEGGERLYIHPIAYSPAGYSKPNRVLYFNPEQFPPYPSSFLGGMADEWCGIRSDFRMLLHQTIGRLWVALCRSIRHWIVFRRIYPDLLAANYDTAVPFLGVSQFDGVFSTTCQLEIIDPDEWCDCTCIIPSQKWLRTKLEEWMAGVKGDYEQDLLNDYRDWEKKWLERGCKIGYLCSIDT